MTRHITRLLPAAALTAVLLTPAAAAAQSQEISDLRRRIDAIEQRMFQQQLSQPPSLQGQAIDRLQMRVDILERDLASDRVNRLAERVTSAKVDPKAPGPKSLEARIAALESERAADAKALAALVKRIEALEKKRENQ